MEYKILIQEERQDALEVLRNNVLMLFQQISYHCADSRLFQQNLLPLFEYGEPVGGRAVEELVHHCLE